MSYESVQKNAFLHFPVGGRLTNHVIRHVAHTKFVNYVMRTRDASRHSAIAKCKFNSKYG